MTKLDTLRSAIARLHRQRASRRMVIGWVALAIAVLWALVAVFALDVYFDLSTGQRLLVLALAAGGVAWAWYRFSRPWLGVKESQIDVALLLERQQGIESDLVAAMQFESPEAAKWGSRQLEEAVVDYVATLDSHLKIEPGDDGLQLRRRVVLLAATGVALAVLTLLVPRYVGTFLNRLAMGGRHYPSDTLIREATINGQLVDLSPGARNTVMCPIGQALDLQIEAAGDVPLQGMARLRSQRDGERTEVLLMPVKESELADAEDSEAAKPEAVAGSESTSADSPATAEDGQRFAGSLKRLMDSVKLQFYLGDAYTDPVTIEVIPLPAVTAELEVTLPEYAQQLAPQLAGQGLQQSVVEGSRVELAIVESSKPLETAQITLMGEQPQDLALEPTNEERTQWRLPIENTPFASVAAPLRFELDVTDRDGQHLATPLAGHVRIQEDQPPRVLTTSMVHRVVLPTAQPVLSYTVLDDYGVAAIDLEVQIERLNGETEKFNVPIRKNDPIMADRLPHSASLPIELVQWNLQPGEHVLFTVLATDHRGETEGEQSRGEGLQLEIADRSELYAVISESDVQAEEIMTSIIDQHIGGEE